MNIYEQIQNIKDQIFDNERQQLGCRIDLRHAKDVKERLNLYNTQCFLRTRRNVLQSELFKLDSEKYRQELMNVSVGNPGSGALFIQNIRRHYRKKFLRDTRKLRSQVSERQIVGTAIAEDYQ